MLERQLSVEIRKKKVNTVQIWIVKISYSIFNTVLETMQKGCKIRKKRLNASNRLLVKWEPYYQNLLAYKVLKGFHFH